MFTLIARRRWSRSFGIALLATTLACGSTSCSDASSDVSDDASGGGGGRGLGGGGGLGGNSSYEPQLVFIDESTQLETARLRYGEPFSVRVLDAPPNTAITLRSALWGYRGWATFTSDDDGSVDTATTAPSDGSYSGVHPDGLLWSMVEETPDQETNYDIEIEVEIGGESVTVSTLERSGLNSTVVGENIDQDGLVGQLFKPQDASQPLPGLLILGGSEGGGDSSAFRAMWLAHYGYVAMGLAYFDEPGLPDELTEIPLEYFDTAIATLAARQDVDAERIAVLGGSRGGELALMLGARSPSIKAVVAEVPSNYRWGAVSQNEASAWSDGGLPLPYLGEGSDAAPVAEELPDGTTAWRLTPAFEQMIAVSTEAELTAATILVEETQGGVLLLAGDDDGIWPSCTFSALAFDRLQTSGHVAAHGDRMHCFEDAGHSAAMPGWPTTNRYAGNIGGFVAVFGGTPEGTAVSQREGLAIIRDFLAEQLD